MVVRSSRKEDALTDFPAPDLLMNPGIYVTLGAGERHHEAPRTRLRNNAKLALPYIWRFISLSLRTKPSTGPLLQLSVLQRHQLGHGAGDGLSRP